MPEKSPIEEAVDEVLGKLPPMPPALPPAPPKSARTGLEWWADIRLTAKRVLGTLLALSAIAVMLIFISGGPAVNPAKSVPGYEGITGVLWSPTPNGCEKSGDIVVGLSPQDLAQHGTCAITFHIVDSGACVDVYDKNMNWLVTDCQGQFHTLPERGATNFVANNRNTVHVTYNTW